MADILKFAVKRRARHTAQHYQLHHFRSDGSVTCTSVFVARSDADARRHALGLIDRHRVELWAGGRFVARFDPIDGLAATSIRFLDDQLAISAPQHSLSVHEIHPGGI